MLKVEDTTHPATKMLGGSWPMVDEFYLFGTAPWDAARPKDNIDVLFGNHIPMGFSRDRVHVLLSLDTEQMNHHRSMPDVVKRGGDYPQAWTREYGKGRSFYTSLGHRDDIWCERSRVPRPHQRRHSMGARARAVTLRGLRADRAIGPRSWPSVPRRASRLLPSFHHLHLNSVNPTAAIEFYAKAFPSTSTGTFAGQPALRSPNNVWVLFNKVDAPPATQPQTAFWHFGWHVTDVRATLDRYLKQNITLLPLYTGRRRGHGHGIRQQRHLSGHRWRAGTDRARGAEAKAKGVKPAGGAGFAYLRGPDDALVEYQGNMPAERFNHVHMYQDQPFCAQLWYQTHLNVAVRGAARGQPARTEANCRVERGPDKTLPALDWDGMYRTPSVTRRRFRRRVALLVHESGRDARRVRRAVT